MKLPQFFRKLMYISLWIFVGLNVIPFVVLLIVSIFHITAPDEVGSGLMTGLIVLWVISFITMMGSMIAAPLVRFVENMGLRGLGTSGIATIIDFHTVTEGQTKWGPNVVGVRLKLRVHTPEGETFEAIAEDSAGEYYDANAEGLLEIGREVPVKYDPLTKEVALVTSKHQQPKVKKPNW